MKYIAGCSFGKDSLATLLVADRYHIKIDEVIYCEVMFDKGISGELPEHRNFIYECAIPKLEKLGFHITVLQSKKTYMDCFYHVIKKSKYPDLPGKYKGFPLTGRCYVQDRCKASTLDCYKKKFKNEYIQFVGITAEETMRLQRLKSNQISLLSRFGLTQQDTKEICRREGLLSPSYQYSKRNGCWFCPNASDSELLHIKADHPELWGKLERLGKEENVATQMFNRKESFLDLNKRLNLI